MISIMFRFHFGLIVLVLAVSIQGCGSPDGLAVIDYPSGGSVASDPTSAPAKRLQPTPRISQLRETESPRNRTDRQMHVAGPSVAIKPSSELGPVWKVDRDGPTPAYSIKDDLEYFWPNLDSKVSPLLACLRGPFGLKPDVKLTGSGKWTIDTENPSPIDIIDLRTGESTGTFSHKIPIDRVSRLSPDGKVLVGPTTDGYRDVDRAKLRSLFVWNAGEDDSKVRFEHADGVRLWYGFVGRREIAVLTRTTQFNKNVQTVHDCVEFFNVETGALRTKLELPYECPPRMLSGIDRVHPSQPWMSDFVAVSPRGKYLAIVGPERLMLVDREGAVLKGTFSMPSLSGNLATVRFSDDASRIVVMALGTYPWFAFTGCHLHIFELDAEDGTCLAQREVLGPTRERFFSSDSIDLRCFDGNPQWVSKEAIVMGGIGSRPGASQATFAKAIFPESRVAIMLDSPELIRMLDTGPALVVKMDKVDSREKYRVMAQKRDSILGLASSKTNSFGDLGNPRLLIPGLPSAVVADEAVNGEKWVPMPVASDSLACNFKDLSDEPNWIFRGSQKSGYLSQTARSLAWQLINPETMDPIGPPLGLLTWDEGSLKNHSTGSMVFAISQSGEKLAFIDPMRNDSLYVVNVDGSRSALFRSHVKAIDWCGFLDNDKILVGGEGSLSLCELRESKVHVSYTTDKRDYHCFAMHPGHEYMAASRTGGIDIVENASGICLNRMMLGKETFARSLSFSPTGKYLAAVCKERADAYHPKEFYVWDMENGEQLRGECESSALAWVGPDLLLVGGPKNSFLYDLKHGDSFLSFATPESVDQKNTLKVNELATSLQGGVWGKTEDEGGWKLLSACRGSRQSEVPFFASDRKFDELGNTPIAIEMYLRKYSVGKQHGLSIAKALQQKGYKIGKGGYTLKVKASEVAGEMRINFKKNGSLTSQLLPRAAYRWTLEDEKRKVIWSGKTFGDFDSKRSRYLVGGTSQGSELNFGSEVMSEAVMSEILEQGNGLEIPKDLPERFMVGGGEVSVVPQKLQWARLDAKPNEASSN